MGGENLDRYRLVVFGSSKCGKTSIIRRYLHRTFSEKYRETVEDIYAKDFRANGNILPLNFYDTNFNYPDMRRVSISAANAFLLVFAVDDVNSFKEVTELIQEVFHRRPDAVDMPLILAGNKCDVTNKKIYPSTVHAWLNHFTSRKDIKYLECSAKEDQNIDFIFKLLFQQSNFIRLFSHGDAANRDGESPKVFHSSSFKHSIGINATPLTHRRLLMNAKSRLVNEKVSPSDQSPSHEDSSSKITWDSARTTTYENIQKIAFDPICREFIKNNIANRTQSDQCHKTTNRQNEPSLPDSSTTGQQDDPPTPDSPIVRNSQFYRTLSCRRDGGLYSPSKNAATNTKRSSVTEESSDDARRSDDRQFSMGKAERLGETLCVGGDQDGKSSFRLTRHVSLMRKGDQRGGSRNGKILKQCPNKDTEDDPECKVS